jgi:hypothetical protein
MALRELRPRVPRSLIIEIVALPLPLRGAAEVGSLLRDLLPDRPQTPYPPPYPHFKRYSARMAQVVNRTLAQLRGTLAALRKLQAKGKPAKAVKDKAKGKPAKAVKDNVKGKPAKAKPAKGKPAKAKR